MATLNEAVQSHVYCQMTGRDISTALCESTQGEDGCLGCGAPTRRCEKCDIKMVAVPIAGLCLTCLAIERAEALDAEREIPTRVQCQIMKRPISAAMCGSMQGQDGCHGCSAPTRKCGVCNERPPHSAKYGLCIECIVAEFAPEIDVEKTDPSEEAEPVPHVVATPKKLPADIEQLVKKYGYVSVDLLTTKLRVSPAVAVERLNPLIAEGSLREDKGDLYVRATGIVVKLPEQPIRIAPEDENPKSRKARLEKARAVIEEHRQASVALLTRNLGVSIYLAKSFLDFLVSEGFIECDDTGKRRRYIYILRQQPQPTPEPVVQPTSELSISDRRKRYIQVLDKFVSVVGEKSEHGKLFLEIKAELVLLDRLDTAIREVLGE